MASADDDVLTLRPSRRRWIGILAIGVAFTAIAIAIALDDSDAEGTVMPLFVGVFFGLVTIVSVCQLVPGSAYLRAGPAGLVTKGLWRTNRQSWDEIERFQVYEVRTQYSKQRQVGFVLREAPGKRSFGRSLSRTLAGVDGGLPDTYGHDPEELVALLESLRARYTTR